MIDQCINKKYKYDVNNDDNNSTYILLHWLEQMRQMGVLLY